MSRRLGACFGKTWQIQSRGGHRLTNEPAFTNGQDGKKEEVDGVGSSNGSAACQHEEDDNPDEEGSGTGDPLEFDNELALVEVFKWECKNKSQDDGQLSEHQAIHLKH